MRQFQHHWIASSNQSEIWVISVLFRRNIPRQRPWSYSSPSLSEIGSYQFENNSPKRALSLDRALPFRPNMKLLKIQNPNPNPFRCHIKVKLSWKYFDSWMAPTAGFLLNSSPAAMESGRESPRVRRCRKIWPFIFIWKYSMPIIGGGISVCLLKFVCME